MDKLQKLHKAELYLLVSFDKVCHEMGLTYFLDSGTALGAIRHGGFIPWDDDIDVAMPRKDYELFLKIGQQGLPNDIFLQSRKSDDCYKRNAAKLRLKGTSFPEKNGIVYKENGIFIDIFPFDNIPSNALFAKCNIKFITSIYHIIRSYRNRGRSPYRINRYFQKLIWMTPESWINSLENFYLNYARHYENKETSKMTSYFWRMTQSKQYIFESNKLLPTKNIIFEGYSVKIMNDPDYYLKMMYGDYMKLPPENQRIAHCSGNIVFPETLNGLQI